MASTARRRGIIAEINVTPLVDIMLVLLIIFMLTAQLIMRQAIEIDLPKAAQATTVKPTTLSITLAADGSLSLDNTRVGAAQLRAGIAKAVAVDPAHPPQAMIAADKRVAHGRVVWVLDLVKSLGVTSFAIEIDPTELVAPPEP
ncbi:MAG TPA: biopolymer transporter ExbD [Kofleriaceae bacterium]|jgi:biopolymer transport protein ExbD|nr:biopolymer transporter ExbD [Kofleriaceae bacterium]